MDGSKELKRKYLPNLTEHLACCNALYQNVLRLLPPSYALGESFIVPIAKYAQLNLQVIEQHKYMEVLSIQFEWHIKSTWLANVVVQLRLYHDMKIAEVSGFVANERVINLLKRDHSNLTISYPTEKRQIHQLLLEWLSNSSPA